MRSIRHRLFAFLALASALLCFGAAAQIPDKEDDIRKGNERPDGTFEPEITVNYTEAKVGSYTLPDPLTLLGGEKVTDAQTWTEKRRPEIVKLFEEHEYGRMLGRVEDVSFEITEPEAPDLDGTALRKVVTIHFTKDKTGPKADLTIYVPAEAEGPVALLLNASFGFRGRQSPNIAEKLIDHGYGYAIANYGEIEPDKKDGLGEENGVAKGIRTLYLKPGQPQPADDEWGAISAWAWGYSRALDYLISDPKVDGERVAITGVSRLGKTALWTAAHDERFAMAIPSCSGEGGAALSRRNYGETIELMTQPARYFYQFAGNWAKYGDDPNSSPVDAHMLIALMAPRPVLLQTGNTDYWSDPYGEFQAAVAAGPVYELFGKKGLGTDVFPAAGEPILHDIGYLMHDGGHGMVPSDWDVFLQFMDMHLKQ
jgi:dienelactone hydrolase